MRKNVEYKQVTKEVVTYVACDGTVFNSEEECQKYEKTAECVTNARFKNCVRQEEPVYRLMDSACPFAYDGTFYRVFIRNSDDLAAVNIWIRAAMCRESDEYVRGCLLGEGCIGKEIILEEYDGYVYNYGDLWDMKKSFCNELDKLFQ